MLQIRTTNLRTIDVAFVIVSLAFLSISILFSFAYDELTIRIITSILGLSLGAMSVIIIYATHGAEIFVLHPTKFLFKRNEDADLDYVSDFELKPFARGRQKAQIKLVSLKLSFSNNLSIKQIQYNNDSLTIERGKNDKFGNKFIEYFLNKEGGLDAYFRIWIVPKSATNTFWDETKLFSYELVYQTDSLFGKFPIRYIDEYTLKEK